MDLIICTIGFAGKTAEEFFALLTDAGVCRVIDVRENRGGQLSGFAKHPDIEFFLKRVAGIDYRHEPLLAPSPEIRDRYRETRDWAGYEPAFLELMRQRDVPEKIGISEFSERVALLCSEPAPEKCHRRLLAELCAAHWRAQGHTVEILHLQKPKPAPKPRRKKAAAITP